jgi:hypothetical protein
VGTDTPREAAASAIDIASWLVIYVGKNSQESEKAGKSVGPDTEEPVKIRHKNRQQISEKPTRKEI